MIDDPVKRAERWFEEQKETSYLLQRQNELEKCIETLEHAQKLTQNPVHTFIKNCCIMRVNYRDGITTTKLYRALRHGAGIIQHIPCKSDFIAGLLSYYSTDKTPHKKEI